MIRRIIWLLLLHTNQAYVPSFQHCGDSVTRRYGDEHFLVSKTNSRHCRRRLTIQYNFFQNLIEQAFQNDDNLSNTDKRKGMLEGPMDEYYNDDTVSGRKRELTETQIEWRRRQQSMTQVTAEDLINRQVHIDLYLTGVPNKDPSNDLYGSRTNISSRDRSVGMAVPTVPTISNLIVQFLSNNKCIVLSDGDSGFAIRGSSTAESNDDDNAVANDSDDDDTTTMNYQVGDWKLSDDGKQIRLRFGVNGYKRTVETKGTIQKVFWSAENESTTRTSTIYSIPLGWLYAEAKLTKQVANASPVTTTTTSPRTGPRIEWDNDTSLLKIEQTTGFFGVSSKMLPCGKFTAKFQ